MEERIKEKVLVLCSGGLDSTVLLYKMVHEFGADNVIALNAYYGQKHYKEYEYAVYNCERLGVQLYNINLTQLYSFNKGSSALLKGSDQKIEHRSYAEQLKDKPNGIVTAYVPFRNGLFLSAATTIAYQLGCTIVGYAAHADDSAGNAYPDCTPEFVKAASAFAWEGTNSINIIAPFINCNKAEIVRQGKELAVDFSKTWSCYEGKDEPCGTCGTCIDRIAALRANGIEDVN